MEQTFEEYLIQARWDFAKVAEKYPVEQHLELRTAIDSLLIAYDQVVHQALSIGTIINNEVFEHYGKPFTSGRDLWDFLTTHYNFTLKKK